MPEGPLRYQELVTTRIRPARAGDEPAIVEVVRTVYDEYGFTWDAEGYHHDLYDIRGHYLDAGHGFWVAEDASGRVIGTVALHRFERLPLGEALVLVEGQARVAAADCSLERLYVVPDARGSGVGHSLFSTTIEAAPREGRSRMEIWSDKRFEAAHRLYVRHGAEIVGDRICQDPDHSPEWGLRLDLRPSDE
jgi:GNAT superfamily N-acetyltransferase